MDALDGRNAAATEQAAAFLAAWACERAEVAGGQIPAETTGRCVAQVEPSAVKAS